MSKSIFNASTNKFILPLKLRISWLFLLYDFLKVECISNYKTNIVKRSWFLIYEKVFAGVYEVKNEY